MKVDSLKPLFICGAARSGTTLTSNLLDAHSEIAMLPNEHHLLLYYNRMEQREFTRFVARDYLYGNDLRFYHDQDFFQQTSGVSENLSQIADSKAFKSEYNASLRGLNEIKISDTFKAIAQAYLKSSCHLGNTDSLKYYAEKRPLDNELWAMQISKELPNAKFIHVLRHPYTRYLSVKKKSVRNNRFFKALGFDYLRIKNETDSFFNFALGIAAKSLISFEMAKRNRELLGNNYLIIRYEDLVSEHTSTIEKVVDHLGVKAEEILKTQTLCGKPVKSNSSFKEQMYSKPQEISKNRLDTFFKFTSKFERNLINLLMFDLATEFGYELEKPELPLGPNVLFNSLKYERKRDFIVNRDYFLKKSIKSKQDVLFFRQHITQFWLENYFLHKKHFYQ